MISKIFQVTVLLLLSITTAFAQCLNGGCEVGLSREQLKDGIFIGHFQNSDKSGLGITYSSNSKGASATYANYNNGIKNGVVYTINSQPASKTYVHTFQGYVNDATIYPAFRVTKQGKKTKIEVAFSESKGWKKFEGNQVVNELQIQSITHDGSPAFIAFNGTDQIMAISTTVERIELLSSLEDEKYYNALQLETIGDRVNINIFPKAGADETAFKTTLDWDIETSNDGLWLYKRFFNGELSYRATYDDVMALPSAQEIKQGKLEKAFDFIAEQVEDYNFAKGYKGKAKDFIDILQDIKERAENKGLAISTKYDLTMVRLHLQNDDRNTALKFARTAYLKSTSSYDAVSNLITSKYPKYSDLLPLIKKSNGVAVRNN